MKQVHIADPACTGTVRRLNLVKPYDDSESGDSVLWGGLGARPSLHCRNLQLSTLYNQTPWQVSPPIQFGVSRTGVCTPGYASPLLFQPFAKTAPTTQHFYRQSSPLTIIPYAYSSLSYNLIKTRVVRCGIEFVNPARKSLHFSTQ